MHQGLELSFWLGIAGLALVSARILLWHTRRVLNQPRQDAEVQEIRRVPAAVKTPVRSVIAS